MKKGFPPEALMILVNLGDDSLAFLTFAKVTLKSDNTQSINNFYGCFSKEFIRALALDLLKDKDKKYCVRKYFSV